MKKNDRAMVYAVIRIVLLWVQTFYTAAFLTERFNSEVVYDSCKDGINSYWMPLLKAWKDAPESRVE